MSWRQVIVAICLLVPMMSMASGGSWSGQSTGGKLSVGKQNMTSPPLMPSQPLPAGSRVISFSWRITPLSPPPTGLQIVLCSQNRCVSLPSLSGRKEVWQTLSAHGPFYFLYRVKHRGQLSPPLTIVSHQLTVNYR